MRKNEASREPRQHGEQQRRPAANVIGPVAGQHEGGDKGQDIGGKRHRDAEGADAQPGLQQRVEGRRQVCPHQEREDDDAGHRQP